MHGSKRSKIGQPSTPLPPAVVNRPLGWIDSRSVFESSLRRTLAPDR